MTTGQEKFFKTLSAFPWLALYWDSKNNEVDIATLKAAMGAMSHGERILASFFLSVWLGENNGFDLVEAAATLDEGNRALIAAWLQHPWWP